MSIRSLLLLFFVLALSSLSSASAVDLVNNSHLILGTVIVLIIITLALMFMICEPLNMPSLKVWVKSELREVIVAGIICAVCISFFYGSTSVTAVLTGVSDYHQSALSFLGNLSERSYAGYFNAIKVNQYVTMRSGFSSSFSAGHMYAALSLVQAPYSGYSALNIILNNISNTLAINIVTLEALSVFLDFIIHSSDKLLYLAFALRFIPFTRSVGSTLIAIILGVYVLFPFALVFLSLTHSFGAPTSNPPNQVLVPTAVVPSSVFNDLSFTLPPGSSFICSEPWMRLLVANLGELGFSIPPCLLIALAGLPFGYGALFAQCFQVMTQFVYPLLTNVVLPILWSAVIIPASLMPANVAAVFNSLTSFNAAVVGLVVLTYVDLILVLMITMVGIRSISLALGGEYMIPGVQRLVS
ncbi:hypothetical protein HY990_00830 [Candidatus Micrarchaeota archaeon]|nr:hypothetical protein [Candidatus Micrarchaeota archaeon]